MNPAAIDLDRLLKLRLVVARFGEMDLAQWWNTKGQLGPTGAMALRRGFPRTFRFAAARSVFAVAAHRCAAGIQSAELRHALEAARRGRGSVRRALGALDRSP